MHPRFEVVLQTPLDEPSVNFHLGFGRDPAHIGNSLRNLLQAEMLDQPVAVGKQPVKTLEHQSQIQLPLSRQHLVDMQHQPARKPQVLDMRHR